MATPAPRSVPAQQAPPALGRLRLSRIPPNRMAALARYALGSKAPLLERAPEPKRTAMLTAVMRHLEAKVIDEALDLFRAWWPPGC